MTTYKSDYFFLQRSFAVAFFAFLRNSCDGFSVYHLVPLLNKFTFVAIKAAKLSSPVLDLCSFQVFNHREKSFAISITVW